MKKIILGLVVAAALFGGASQVSAATLTGTLRDFCAPDIAGTCTRLTDFEGAISGLATGMLSSTLSGGLPTFVAPDGTGASTAANFAKWYVDSPGFNTSLPYSITLTETSPGSGVFTYANSAFFPLDGLGFGNQGNPHNYHFTMHLSGLTSFKATDTFSFTGDDDLWIYIDGKLVMDLGGVHPPLSATMTGADLIGMGLSPDTIYDLDVFFAERHTVLSNFSITTSFRITPSVPEPSSMALLGLALSGLAVARKRRRA